MKSKVDALLEVIHQARSSRSSIASLKRLRKAGAVLGLTPDEQAELETALEYRPHANQPVYPSYEKGRGL